ncbi:hypothetical protein [Paenibacillus alvei]|jgi:hypothetical protein|nr:hypothetical protein [Paenibacillus alvei]
MKIKPEQRGELKLDVKGYGCWDDCRVYYADGAYERGCGWDNTAYNNPFS